MHFNLNIREWAQAPSTSHQQCHWVTSLPHWPSVSTANMQQISAVICSGSDRHIRPRHRDIECVCLHDERISSWWASPSASLMASDVDVLLIIRWTTYYRTEHRWCSFSCSSLREEHTLRLHLCNTLEIAIETVCMQWWSFPLAWHTLHFSTTDAQSFLFFERRSIVFWFSTCVCCSFSIVSDGQHQQQKLSQFSFFFTCEENAVVLSLCKLCTSLA